jgi:hypothetical protein
MIPATLGTIGLGLCLSCYSISCGGAIEPSARPSTATRGVPRWDLAGVGPNERVEFDALLRETQSIVQSDEFQRRLTSVGSMRTAGLLFISCSSIAGDTLVEAYLAEQWPTYYRMPTGNAEVTDTPNCRVESPTSLETAHTGLTTAERAETCVQKLVLRRWRSGTVDDKACAINTIAHEWSHSISKDGSVHELVLDDGHNCAIGAVASYTVGAIAQCVFIERAVGQMSKARFSQCLDLVGRKDFKANACTVSQQLTAP